MHARQPPRGSAAGRLVQGRGQHACTQDVATILCQARAYQRWLLQKTFSGNLGVHETTADEAACCQQQSLHDTELQNVLHKHIQIVIDVLRKSIFARLLAR